MTEDLSKYNPEGSTLRKAQLRMLDMLVEIDKVCRKHHIPYWLDFGTLLGAIRHKGFIPWDDDVDICVLQKDYDRLKDALIFELSKQYAFQDSSTDSYAFSDCGRLRDRKSYCYHPHFVKLKEQGVWIDIYRYSLVNSRVWHNFVDFFYRRAYREIHNYGVIAYKSKVHILFNKTIAYIMYPFCLLAKKIIEYIGEHSKNSFLMPWSFSPRVLYPNKLFPLVEVEFEGHMFFAPKCWHEHLTEVYGDYMQIPPENARKQLLDMNKVQIFD